MTTNQLHAILLNVFTKQVIDHMPKKCYQSCHTLNSNLRQA